MDKTKIALFGLLAIFLIYLAFSLPAVREYYMPQNYLLINGKKYTENDLKKLEFPPYMSIRKNHNNELQNVFYSFASQEVINLEAKISWSLTRTSSKEFI